jgi:hypothetical protein
MLFLYFEYSYKYETDREIMSDSDLAELGYSQSELDHCKKQGKYADACGNNRWFFMKYLPIIPSIPVF